jgi:hypothetical protein
MASLAKLLAIFDVKLPSATGFFRAAFSTTETLIFNV